jgi:hypothetical protein
MPRAAEVIELAVGVAVSAIIVWAVITAFLG